MSQVSFEKKVKLKKSTAASTYNTVPANSASLNLTSDLLDDTDFTTTGFRSRVVGLRDWNVSMTVRWDSANQPIKDIRDAWLKRQKVSIRYLVDGTNGWQGDGFVESFSLSGDVGGLEQVDVSIQPESALSTYSS